MQQNKLQAITRPGTGTIPSSLVCKDNYCYYDGDDADEINLWFGLGTSRVSAVELASNPLSTNWDPANGRFGAYTITPAEDSVAPTVPVGAQRADMNPVTTPGNSASYQYDTNDLGKL